MSVCAPKRHLNLIAAQTSYFNAGFVLVPDFCIFLCYCHVELGHHQSPEGSFGFVTLAVNDINAFVPVRRRCRGARALGRHVDGGRGFGPVLRRRSAGVPGATRTFGVRVSPVVPGFGPGGLRAPQSLRDPADFQAGKEDRAREGTKEHGFDRVVA